MTLQELRNRVRGNLSEREEGFFLDSDINDWLNNAQQDVAKKAYHLQEYRTASGVNGKEFSLPGDFYKLHVLKVDGEKVLKGMSGAERQFELWEDEIIFNFELEDSTIELFYYRLPVKMTADTDEPEVPEEHQSLLVNYAMYEAEMKDEKPQKAQAYYKKYRRDLADMIKDYGKKPTTNKVRVVR